MAEPNSKVQYLHSVKVSSLVYIGLIFLGGWSTAKAVGEGLEARIHASREASGGVEVAATGAVWLFVVTSLIHQGFIYRSIYRLDYHAEELRDQFPKWVSSWFEVCLRFIVFVLLLAATGKVFTATGKVFTELALSPLTFAWIIFSCFAANFLWDIVAAFYLDKSWKSTFKDPDSLIWYVVCDVLALIMWGCLVSILWSGAIAWIFLLVALLVIYLAAIGARTIVQCSKYLGFV